MRLQATVGLALVLLCVPLVGVSAQTVQDPIQPGDPLVGGDGEPYCTLSFVFDSEDNDTVYFATAAHCLSQEGQTVHTENHEAFGTVALIGNAGNVSQDYSLIEVHEEAADAVDASVRGHDSMPTGVATSEDTLIGDLVTMSGWGQATNQTSTTRENRTGVLHSHSDQLVRLEGPVTPGDSGGPWMHDSTGLALGIVSQISANAGVSTSDVEVPIVGLTVGAPTPDAFVGNQGPAVTSLLDGAEDAGYDLSLRTAS